jgi:ribosomal-protein-alanine N-acetyltransferase
LLGIPFPYREEDAEEIISRRKQEYIEQGYPLAFAIREGTLLIGLCGAFPDEGGSTFDVGYWLGEEYWGRDIMEYCLRALMDIGTGSCSASCYGHFLTMYLHSS